MKCGGDIVVQADFQFFYEQTPALPLETSSTEFYVLFAGYGHIYPITDTGRAITIVYAIIGIPMFLILLTDFGKLFTRGIKVLWAYVRRLYYTGSLRRVRKQAQVQVSSSACFVMIV